MHKQKMKFKRKGLVCLEPGPLWGRGGLCFVNLMILTAKNNKISVKIADYGVPGEYEQAAYLNLENNDPPPSCSSWLLGKRNARPKSKFALQSRPFPRKSSA